MPGSLDRKKSPNKETMTNEAAMKPKTEDEGYSSADTSAERRMVALGSMAVGGGLLGGAVASNHARCPVYLLTLRLEEQCRVISMAVEWASRKALASLTSDPAVLTGLAGFAIFSWGTYAFYKEEIE